MGDTAGNDFERERQRCIERNNKLLAELGLPKVWLTREIRAVERSEGDQRTR